MQFTCEYPHCEAVLGPQLSMSRQKWAIKWRFFENYTPFTYPIPFISHTYQILLLFIPEVLSRSPSLQALVTEPDYVLCVMCVLKKSYVLNIGLFSADNELYIVGAV